MLARKGARCAQSDVTCHVTCRTRATQLGADVDKELGGRACVGYSGTHRAACDDT
jgi:hypothetical protein